MSQSKPEAILLASAEGWELWKFPAKSAPEWIQNPDEKQVASATPLLVGLPTRALVGLPLWVAHEGNAKELVELELSSRHLLRRNAAVTAVPIVQRDERSLVLAVASSDDSPASEYFHRAQYFEVPARLLDAGGKDIVVWKEFGNLCFAFYREGQCVFFTGTGESSPGPAFCGLVKRTALRLRAEDVISHIPSSLRLIGSFSEEERRSLAKGLSVDLEYLENSPPPQLLNHPSDPAPPAARQAQVKRNTRRRVTLVGSIALACYLVVLAFLGGELILRVVELRRLRAEEAALDPAAKDAIHLMNEWEEYRGAVDPHSFALDQLAAVAREIPGEQVRLTQFTLDGGRLIISGEAPDITQADTFFDRVRHSLALQEYDWKPRQHQLAGKTKIRFEMEGIRPDAKIGNQ